MHRNGKNAVDCGEKFTFHRVAPHNSGFSQKQRKHLAEYIMAELLPNCSNAQDWNGPSLYNRRKCYVAREVLTAADRI